MRGFVLGASRGGGLVCSKYEASPGTTGSSAGSSAISQTKAGLKTMEELETLGEASSQQAPLAGKSP